MDSDKMKTSECLIQIVSTACICFMACQTGFVTSWPSYTIANFVSNETVLEAPMSTLHVSLLGSIMNVGGLAVSPFTAYAFNKFGRKYATMLFVLPYVIAWTILSFTKSIVLVLMAMAFAGVGVAGQNASIMFISEIAHNSIRGSLSSSSASGFFIGLLISYALGGYLTYSQVIYTHLTLSVLCVCLLMLLPESPVYLVLVGKEKQAAKSISFYRWVDIDSKVIEAEIAKIRVQLDPRLEKMLEGGKDLEAAAELMNNSKPTDTRSESSWKFLLNSKSSKRALATALIVMALSIMMGGVTLQTFAEPLFKEAVPSMQPNQCAIFLAVDFTIASMVCVFVVDRYGRKPLLIVTAFTSAVCTTLLGVQLTFHLMPHWATALLIYMFVFFYTSGCATVPFVFSTEFFLPEVRGLCNSIVLATVWIFNFLTLVIFNPIVENWGLGPVFFFFSCVGFGTAVYSYYCIPETRGLSVDAIQALFLQSKKLKVTDKK